MIWDRCSTCSSCRVAPRLFPIRLWRRTPDAAGQRSTFLFVGTSFRWGLVNAMYMSQSGEYCDMLYYNKSHVRLHMTLRLCNPATTSGRNGCVRWTVNHPTGSKSSR